MRSIARQVTSRGWTAPARVLTKATAGPRRAIIESIPGAASRGLDLGIPKLKPRGHRAQLAAARRALLVDVSRANAEVRYDEYIHREVRDPLDRLVTWGLTFLAVAMAIGYQLLLRTEALKSFLRRR